MFISTSTITLTTYLGSWALVISVIAIRFMVDQCPFLLEALARVDNNTFPFQQHIMVACDLLPPPTHACIPPFEQFIGQQMVQFQDSILEHLHHHTLSNMPSDEIFKAHHGQILSCSGPRVNTWLIARLIFSAFRLSSPIFSIAFHTWLKLSHLSIVGIPQCVCTHPIDPTNIHFLHCVHGNERTGTHDAICNTFVAIMQDASLHMGWEQLHVLPLTTFNPFCQQINIVLTKDGICTLTDIVIADSTQADLLPQSCATQGFVTKEKSYHNQHPH
jgi:hypothetical protein